MSPPADGPNKRQYLSAQSRRESILRVADEVLAQEGAAHLSIVEVAHRAGISRQLVYQHFSDLNALLVEVIKARLTEWELSLDARDGARQLEVRELVEFQLRRLVNLNQRDRQLMRDLFGDITALPKDLWPTIAEIRRAVVFRWTNLIDPQSEPNSLSFAKIGLIMHAIMGAWDMMIDGSLSEDDAVTLLLKVTESLFILPW
ncbi:MAG: TetR/AcrR family transcriptional regulator [Acidobacteria bacterium]|nr:TetR/AcrR family transcriptional regulator [Acidobacteriota bacterium]